MNKNILLLVLLLCITIFISCSKKEINNYEASYKNAIQLKNATVINPAEKMQYHDGLIYYVQEARNKIYINIINQKGKLKKIPLTIGKGPGEIISIFTLKIRNNKIYAYDAMLQKIIIYNIKGELIKQFNINRNIGTAGTFDVLDGYIYFHGIGKNKLVKLDMDTGQIQKVVVYQNPVNLENIWGQKVPRGILNIDHETKKIYIGFFNKPFRVEVYNTNLKLLTTLKRKLNDNYQNLTFNRIGNQGNFLISTICFDDKYVYLSFGGGQKFKRDRNNLSVKPIKKYYYVSVFDKHTNEFIGEITIDKLPYISGVSNIIGVSKSSIYYFMIDFDDTFFQIDKIKKIKNKKSDKKNDLSIFKSIIITDNPLYKN